MAVLQEDAAVAKQHEGEPPPERDRLDLRIDPSLRVRINKARKRWGLSVSAYIRVALIEKLERDEADPPPEPPAPRRRR